MKSRTRTVAIVTLVGVFSGLAVLNPSEQQHKAALTEAVVKSHRSRPGYRLVSAEKDMVNRLIYHNYVIFSVTKDPEWHPRDMEIGAAPMDTIGVCGKVYVRVNLGTW